MSPQAVLEKGLSCLAWLKVPDRDRCRCAAAMVADQCKQCRAFTTMSQCTHTLAAPRSFWCHKWWHASTDKPVYMGCEMCALLHWTHVFVPCRKHRCLLQTAAPAAHELPAHSWWRNSQNNHPNGGGEDDTEVAEKQPTWQAP